MIENMKNEEVKTISFSLKVKEDIKDEFKKVVKEEGRNISFVMMDLMREYIKLKNDEKKGLINE